MDKKRKTVNLLKGFAALCIFFGHFYDCFYCYNGADADKYNIVKLFYDNSYLRIFRYGWFFNYVFCILSGFFSANKEIDSIKRLVYEVIRRYLRLMFFVLSANIVLGVLHDIGFTPTEADAFLLRNQHMPLFADLWTAIVWGIILKPINGAMWLVKSIFVGNILIYVLKYLNNKIDKRIYFEIVPVLIGAVVFFNVQNDASYIDEMLTVTLLGYTVWSLVKNITITENKVIAFSTISISYMLIAKDLSVADVIFRLTRVYLTYKTIALFSAVLLCISSFFFVYISNCVFDYISDMSTVIWVLHIPVIYTICLRLYMNVRNRAWNYDCVFIGALIVGFISIFLLSFCYKEIVEKSCDKLCFIISDKIKRLLKI